MMQVPPLNIGNKVALVSSARKISSKEVQPAIDILSSWGLEVVKSKNLHKSHHQMAGTKNERLEDLQGFIDNPEIKAIFFTRGGYGTVQLIDDLDFTALTKNPKHFIGYSDVTVLLNSLSNLGFSCIHATMPINFKNNTQESLSSLKSALFGQAYTINSQSHSFNKTGKTKAEITGGNLSIIYSQCGSKSALNTAGKILFIEDLDEYLYHIDRMMYNLKRNGYFQNLEGLIVGGMTDMNDNSIPFGESAEAIIKRHFYDIDIPIAFGFPAGHLEDNRALIFGTEAYFEVHEKGSILSFS